MQVRGPSKTLDYASLSYCDGDRGKSDRQCRLLVAAANLQSCYLSLTSRRTAHLRYEQQKMEGAISSVPDGAAQHHIIASLPCGDGDGSMAGSGRRRQEEVISGRRVNRASTRVIQQSSNQPVARQRLPQYQSCQQGSTKCRTCGQPSGTFHTSTQASTGARPIPSSPAPTWLLTLPLPIASQRRLEPTSRARQVKKGCRAVLARADLKKNSPDAYLCYAIYLDVVRIKNIADYVQAIVARSIVSGSCAWDQRRGRQISNFPFVVRPTKPHLDWPASLGAPCRRSSVLGLTSSAALAPPGP